MNDSWSDEVIWEYEKTNNLTILTFGNAVLESFLKTDINEIRIFSRDEKKQDDMRQP